MTLIWCERFASIVRLPVCLDASKYRQSQKGEKSLPIFQVIEQDSIIFNIQSQKWINIYTSFYKLSKWGWAFVFCLLFYKFPEMQ